jgi:phage baseplate assembly protein gpV
MRFRGSLSLIGALVTLFAAPALAGAPISWNNAAGGNWGTAANWDPAQVPTAAADVLITLDGTYTVTINVAAAAASLTLGDSTGVQTLAMAANSLTLGGASNVGASGIVNMSGGSLAGNGSLTVNGTFNWTGGSMDGAGSTDIAATATLSIGGGASVKTHRRVINKPKRI